MPPNEIQCLYDIAAIPIELEELDAVFPHMMEHAVKLFEIEAAALYLDDSRKLILHAPQGMKHIPLPVYLPDPDETIQNRAQVKARPFPHELPAAGLLHL